MHPVVMKFEAYLLTEKRVAQNTFNSYKRDLAQFMQFLVAQEIELEKVTITNLKSFLHHLNAIGLSPRSMSRKISSLKSFYAYCSRYIGSTNVAEDLTFPKLDKRLPNYLTQDEMDQLFQVASQDTSDHSMRNKVMLYLLYVSGMRITEMTTLKISHIQFEPGRIMVTGKGGKARVIPIPSMMIDLLKKYIDVGLKEFMKTGKKKRQTDYLFPIYYAGTVRPITRQAFWGILNMLWKKTGIQKSISPHKLRHSLATHMLHNGADLRSLQLILGHENLATVQIYTHLETGYLRKVYDKKHPRS